MRLIIIRMAFRTGNIKFTWPFRLFSRYHWISRWISYIWQRLLWCSFLLTVLSIDIPLCSFRAWYALICGCIENWCILCAGNAILSVEIREIFRAMDTCLVGFWYLCHIFTSRGMWCIRSTFSSIYSLYTLSAIFIPSPFTLTGCTLHICWIK